MKDYSQNETIKAAAPAQTRAFQPSDVVIGILVGIDDSGTPLVVYPGSPSDVGLAARATIALDRDEIGCEVALLFENGDTCRPLIIGRIRHPQKPANKPSESAPAPATAQIDGEVLTFNAEKEIVLRCGRASITLTRAGKVLIRGSYLLSRSSGANRIKGGSIQLN